ncbi:helix-turn-helix transcriptional regulator [Streptomyces lincolnensis]|uniref:helix-turn-helix transcriptional regulator n=1 Tax=Streptomyces lincolnensis TaxID=1915 RepID=UPI001E3ED251|nr:helix-turn-helix transcriptional regulator [Streptomyces lincolnensis]MCD7439727.1 helix-turn-helix transcriptional regulator [Streptomyces lincolnensis]
METTIGAFLRTRRERITPEQAGLPPSLTRRRVPGLRREEVALLAGVSPDYYQRLEQGRTAHVSDQVLNAVAQALSLSDIETEHLRNLARPSRLGAEARATQRASGVVSDEPLVRLLEAIGDAPALLLDAHLDIVAANAAAEAVFAVSSMPQPRNAARELFLHPEARSRYANWEAIAAETVAQLRLLTGRRPDDAKLATLVGELAIRSEPFRQLWATGDVREKRLGVARIVHPVVGTLEFDYHMLTVPARPDRTLLTYLPRLGSSTAEALGMLLSWVANRPDTAGQDVSAAAPESDGEASSATA